MSTSSSPVGNEPVTAYDETPYPSSSFPQSHPNRLAAMARLFGIPAAAPMAARVLELGCADGANLLPMAEQMPGASFLGVDASKVQISSGQKAIEAAGLKNVELRQQNILDFQAPDAKFDYIIVHGVYSWVPDAVREKILSICEAHLAEKGVAYISYNALPGWNMRRSIRDMMLFHARNFTDPAMKVQQARALLAFMSDSVPTENNPYGLLLKQELGFMSGQLDNYLRHDVLEEENTPCYFHEFIGRATKHGMQYLSEPSIAQMLAANFPEKVRDTLAKLQNQIVAQEQYMDFLRNRAFRQTLLCRQAVAIRRNLSPEGMKQFAFSSLLKRTNSPVDLTAGVAVNFATVAGAQIGANDPFVKALLQIFAETNGVRAIAFGELLDTARLRSRSFFPAAGENRDAVDEATLQGNLLNLLAKGVLELWAEPVAFGQNVSEKPLVSALGRHQALNARLITNRLHQSVPADALSRYIVDACDGTRTKEEIVARLVERVKEGKLEIKEGQQKLADEERLRLVLRPRVDAALRALGDNGFFAPN